MNYHITQQLDLFSCSHKNLYMNVHSALFIIIRKWNQPSCLSTGESTTPAAHLHHAHYAESNKKERPLQPLGGLQQRMQSEGQAFKGCIVKYDSISTMFGMTNCGNGRLNSLVAGGAPTPLQREGGCI